MENIKKPDIKNNSEEDLGFLLWQLEEMKEFYPCFKTMIKND